MARWQAWVPMFEPAIRRAATEYRIEPVKLAAVVMQESAGDPRAYRYEPGFWRLYLAEKAEYQPAMELNADGVELWKRRVSASYGLCQLMYPTAVWLMGGAQFEPEELFEPSLSLDLGARLLRMHLDKGRTWEQALAAYNTGRADASRTHYDDKVVAKEALLRRAGVYQGGDDVGMA